MNNYILVFYIKIEEPMMHKIEETQECVSNMSYQKKNDQKRNMQRRKSPKNFIDSNIENKPKYEKIKIGNQ